MKVGYSTLLGEYILADEIGPDDAAKLHIVCPACRNIVDKDVRKNGSETTHLFSHRRIPAEWCEECERRVRDISSEQITSTNHHARHETLEMLKSVLWEALEMMPIRGVTRSARISLISAEPARLWIDNLVRASTSTRLQKFVASNDALIERSGLVTETNLSDGLQSMFADELMRTIIEDGLPHLMNYMIARSFCTVFSLERTDCVPTGRARKLLFALDKEENANPTVFLHWSMADAIIRELHRIPYLKMIANERQGAEPLAGLTINDFIADRELDAGVPDDEFKGAGAQRAPLPLTIVGDGPIYFLQGETDDQILMGFVEEADGV